MAKKINPHQLKASDIRAAMINRWTAPEWAIMWEVAEGTGARGGRYADAVMMSLWPSRGLELHGVEIKISRADWKREAADPTKAEAIAKYCDRWWVHTPEGVVDDLSDMPPAWGLREWTGKRWNTVREASLTNAEPITRHFLAALLRRGDELMKSMIREANAEAHKRMHDEAEHQRGLFQDRVKQEVERRTGELSGVQAQLEAFEEAFGGKVNSWSPNMKAIGHAAMALVEADNSWASNRAELFQKAADAMHELSKVCKSDAAA